MANKRQTKKNLKTYSQKVRGKSKRNTRSAAEGVSAPVAITINPCAEVNVVPTRPDLVPARMLGVKFGAK